MTKPLTLVAGFLGSGKTTLLRQMLGKAGKRRLLFVVNEFAPDEIDATLLADAGGLARAVAGGSVFCECRADTFKNVLLEAAKMANLDGVIVEASGMAEPRAMGRVLSDPRLADAYEVSALIAVADPLTFPKLRHTLPAAEGQIAGADIIVLNKCDLATPDQVARARVMLEELNPGARIHETAYSKIDFDPLARHRKTALGTDVALTNAGDRSFASILAHQSAPVKFEDFAQAIADLGTMVVRVKGWLATPDQGRLFVEMDASGRPLQHSPASKGEGRLVTIVKMNAQIAAINRLARVGGLTVGGA